MRASGYYSCAGGGAYNSKLINCTVVNNSTKSEFSKNGGVSSCSLVNSIVYDNLTEGLYSSNNHGGSTFSYSCTIPLPAGEGNISNNPNFEVTSEGKYYLAFNSLCIDAGTNMGWMTGAKDLAGNPRIIGERVDMGCYEAVPETVCLFGCQLLIYLFFLRLRTNKVR